MVRLISNSAAWLALAVSLSFAGCAHGFSGGASAFALMGLRKGGVGAASSAETLSNVVAARSLLQGSAGARGKRHSALGGASSLRAEALSGAGLIFGPRGEEEGEFFDSKCFARPVVKRYRTVEGDENWRMWYSGRDTNFDPEAIGISTGRVGLAESTDGINWERLAGDEELGSVLDFNTEEWWGYDTVHTMAGDVQIISTDKVRGSSAVTGGYGVNFMFVSGGDAEEVDMGGVSFGGKTLPEGTSIKGLRMRIGLALSYDGIHWTRMEGDHETGAIFDVGDEGEFDALMCGWPQVVQHTPGDLRMYYTTYDTKTETWGVGLARSTDGFKWNKIGKIVSGGGPEGSFDQRGVSRVWVCMNPSNREYVMFCEGHGPKGHTIGTYVSPDGIEWSRKSTEPVFEPASEGNWDSEHVAFPCVMPMDDGSCRLYYSCSPKEGASGIGMAVSDGTDWTRFTRHAAK